MRVHGQLIDMPAAAAHDHVCWVYRDERDLAAAALEFLGGGLARGERLLVVGDVLLDGLRRDASALGGLDDLIAEGRLQTLSLAEAYAATGAFSAERQLAFYDAATRQALDDGYRGLRVVAEVSGLAADARTQQELVRWEHVADGFISYGPGMTAMCAYRADLPAAALDEVVSVHPLVRASAPPPAFQLFFDEQVVAVVGDVDALGAERLTRVLAGSPVRGGVRTLDLSGLQFADVAGCRAIAGWARSHTERGVAVELRNAPALVERAWHLLALDEWVSVAFTEAA
jgi:ABC-type transporter Mla MlaB component